MSYLNFKNFGNVFNKIPSVGETNTKDYNQGFLSSEQLDWSPEIAAIMLKILLEHKTDIHSLRRIELNEPYRSAVYRFALALKAYLESDNPVQSFSELLRIGLNKDCVEIQKRIRAKSILTSWGTSYDVEPEWWKDTEGYLINNPSDLFHYRHFPFWKTDDDKDYEYYFIDVDYDEEISERFRLTLRGILEEIEEVHEVLEEEILLKLSGSKSLDKNNKSSYHWKNKCSKRLEFSNSFGTAKRTLIPVESGSIRDTVILNVDSLNTIQLLDKQTFEVVKQLDQSLHVNGEEKFQKRLLRLNDLFFFLQRDLKKEGITKPRYLLKIMLEELHLKFPEIKAFKFTDFYEDIKIIINDELKYPKRGHGLGMANSLTTLMQITIAQLSLQYGQEKDPSFGVGDFLCLNDDFVIGFSTQDALESYYSYESYITDKLGLIRNPEKSFFSHNWYTICEKYVYKSALLENNYFKRYEVLVALASNNIVQAKAHVNSISMLDNQFVDEYLSEIIRIFGYEFFPEEVRYPYICGGWKSNLYLGVSLDLIELEKLEYKSSVYHAYLACQTEVRRKPYFSKEKKGFFQSPLIQLFGWPRREISELPFFREDIEERYFKTKIPTVKQLYWSKLLEKRKKVFKNSKKQIPFAQFIEEIVKNSSKDFFPLTFMVDHIDEGENHDKSIDVLHSDYELLSLIGYSIEKSIKNIIPERFSFYYKSLPDLKNIIDIFETKIPKIAKRFDKDILSILNFGYRYPTENLSWESYINPIAVAYINEAIRFETGIPILKIKYRKTFLKERTELWKKIPSYYEQVYLSQLADDRQTRLSIWHFLLEKSQKENTSTLELIQTYHQEYLQYLKGKEEQKISLFLEEFKNPENSDEPEQKDSMWFDPFDPDKMWEAISTIGWVGPFAYVAECIKKHGPKLIYGVMPFGSTGFDKKIAEDQFDKIEKEFPKEFLPQLLSLKTRYMNFVFHEYDDLGEDLGVLWGFEEEG